MRLFFYQKTVFEYQYVDPITKSIVKQGLLTDVNPCEKNDCVSKNKPDRNFFLQLL